MERFSTTWIAKLSDESKRVYSIRLSTSIPGDEGSALREQSDKEGDHRNINSQA
jgi:hypothetical protein